MAAVTKQGLIAVTTSDTTTYNPPLKRLYIGVTGDVSVIDVFGNTVVFKAVAVGWLKIQNSPAQSVKATNTTATNIVGDTNPEN